jgi:hypothetical protein
LGLGINVRIFYSKLLRDPIQLNHNGLFYDSIQLLLISTYQ